MLKRDLSLRHGKDFCEKYEQGSVGSPFQRWGSEFYFQRIAMETDNLGTLRSWLNMHGKNQLLTVGLAVAPSV